jgi:hypothetical protein
MQRLGKVTVLALMQEASDDEESMIASLGGLSLSDGNRAMYSALQQDVCRTLESIQRPQQWSSGGRNFSVASMTSHANQRSVGVGHASSQGNFSTPGHSSLAPSPAPNSVGPGPGGVPWQLQAAWNTNRSPAGFMMPGPGPSSAHFGHPQAAWSPYGHAPGIMLPPHPMMHSAAAGPSPTHPLFAHFGPGQIQPHSGAGRIQPHSTPNMYANSRQRSLVQQTREAVEKK